MKTLEQYNHTIKSAKSIIISAFENVPIGDIDFNYVNGKLHAIVYLSDKVTHDELEVAMQSLQDEEVLGSSIEIEKIKPQSHIKIVVDEKLLESKTRSNYIYEDFLLDKTRVLIKLAEEYGDRVIEFMQERGHELLDKQFDTKGLCMLFSKDPSKMPGLAKDNILIIFHYLTATGGFDKYVFSTVTTNETKINHKIGLNGLTHFNSIEKEYSQRKGYSW